MHVFTAPLCPSASSLAITHSLPFPPQRRVDMGVPGRGGARAWRVRREAGGGGRGGGDGSARRHPRPPHLQQLPRGRDYRRAHRDRGCPVRGKLARCLFSL